MARKSMSGAVAAGLVPAALGTILNVALPNKVDPSQEPPSAITQSRAGKQPKTPPPVCNFESLEACPVIGCTDPGSGHAALNQRKRTIPEGGSPTVLSFDDFAALQSEAGHLFPPQRDLEIPAADRAKLADLKFSQGTVSEGDLIQVIAFIVADAHPNAGESVNCSLKGQQNNDFHIPIGGSAGSSDFQGIVVEMIPQDRNPAWTLPKLLDVQSKKIQIRVTGQLMYDSIHVPNSDPNHILGGQPHRMSLWEVHPITEFLVCAAEDGTAKSKCNPSTAADWLPLEKYPAPQSGQHGLPTGD